MLKLPFFFYRKGRDHLGARELLANTVGMLQCDGFSVYETLNRRSQYLSLMNCMAHTHSEFYEARSNDAERAETALTLIKLLYAVEEKARNMGLNPEQRLQLRLTESKPIFDTLEQWLQTEHEKVTPASAIGKAIQYALNRWKNLSMYLKDGKIEIDNNLVENIIRPIAIGRKNYLFAGSHSLSRILGKSARRKAMFYNFFAACKQHHVNPEK